TLKPIGRKGAGPGELSNPVSLAITPAGSILVWDFARRGFVGWSAKGDWLPTLPFERPGIPNNVYARSDSLLYFSTFGQDSARLIRYTPAAWTTVEARPQPPSLLIGKGLCGLVEYRMPPLFTPTLAWTAWGSDFAVSHGTEYQVQLTSATGQQVLVAPVKPRPATRQMAIDQLGPSRTVVQGMPACEVSAERIIDAVGMATHLPAYQRLVAASPNTLWAIRYAPKGEPGWADVYERIGGYRGTVALGPARPVAFLKNGRMLSVETTEDDVPLVVAYSVSPRPR
ncbi:MAG TPA: hypothetical protein VG817_03655, partial [Gemmatimonadales bacterium]|nr:hypothetical protein [Gemmatimonadales bacterium]